MVSEMEFKETSRLSKMAIIKKKTKSLEPQPSRKMVRLKRRERKAITQPLEPNLERIRSKRRSK
jgi:hypothetical protein